MRRNYFAKLINYIKNVYHIDESFNKYKDGRVNPQYKTKHVLLPLLFGLLLRIESLNKLKYLLKDNEFKNLFPKGTQMPSVDTIRDTLKVLDMKGPHLINKSIINRAVRNKVFDSGTIDGYIAAAIDGTKFFGSYKKSCSQCFTTSIKGKSYFYHSGSVMAIIGDGPRLVIDYEPYNSKTNIDKDEGEINASKRLLTRVMKDQKSLIDVIVYDALVCNSVWINQCLDLKVDTIVGVKNNNNKSLRGVKKLVNKSKPREIWDAREDGSIIKVYEKYFYMKGVDRPLRFIKFTTKYEDKRRSQIMIVTTSQEMSLETLYKMIKARWNIENSVFNNLKAEADLGHCFVHGGNAVEAIISLIFIAFNLFQLFKLKRIKNHIHIQKELVRLLVKGLYLLRYDKSLIFDTG